MIYTAESWRPEVERLVAAEFSLVNVAVAMRWLEIESGGNPCAIGSPTQFGPDMHPREIGLGQLYNPDDFAAQGVPVAPLRAYCVGNGQTVARALTQDERDQQVRETLLWKIEQCRLAADATCARFGIAWPSTSPDYWALVKAPHAYPPIVNRGMPAVVTKLGRAPATWAEFVAVLGMSADELWDRALAACETCGKAYAP